jgi:hypothetical protein
LQHNPFDEQYVVIRKIRESLKDGGHVIIPEGVGTDPPPHAFYRALDDWIEVFEKSGFRNIAIQRYYYYHWGITAAWRLAAIRSRLASLFMRQRSSRGEVGPDETKSNPEKSAEIPEPKSGYLRNLAMRTLVGLDAPAEFALMRRNVALPHHNCGFLFQAI